MRSVLNRSAIHRNSGRHPTGSWAGCDTWYSIPEIAGPWPALSRLASHFADRATNLRNPVLRLYSTPSLQHAMMWESRALAAYTSLGPAWPPVAEGREE